MNEQTPRTDPPPCPECGSTECVWGSLHPFGANHSLRITVPPDAWTGKTSDMVGLVCTRCGYMRAYAKDPQRFRSE